MSRSLSFLFLALALTATSFAACGTTPGRVITMRFFAEGDGDTFTTRAGWTVDLTDAHVVLGPVYVLAPIATTLRDLVMPVAYAHGGHDDFAGRVVRAEWLEQASVDLLAAERTSLGLADGSAGPAGDVTIDLEPPSADAAAPTQGHHAWIAGTATMGATTIPFEGGLDIPDDGLSRRVEGIPASGDFDTDGELTVTVHVSSWLDEMHFDRLAAPATGETRVIATGSQPYNAWYIGARTSSAFSTTYVAPEGL
jgi:hypothetical protein